MTAHDAETPRKFSRLTEEDGDRFLLKIAPLAIFVHDVPTTMHLERDPTDEPYLNLAIATKALFIVSRDNDLLDLTNDDEFRTAYPALTIMDPVAFLQHVRAEAGK